MIGGPEYRIARSLAIAACPTVQVNASGYSRTVPGSESQLTPALPDKIPAPGLIAHAARQNRTPSILVIGGKDQACRSRYKLERFHLVLSIGAEADGGRI